MFVLFRLFATLVSRESTMLIVETLSGQKSILWSMVNMHRTNSDA
jgi:hypothetical protein